MATRALQTISETALQVRRCLQASDEHEALRWVAQFVDEFERAPEADRPRLVADEPAGTGDPHWDAMLAGVVEHLCFRSLHASAFVSTPPALANRGVFIHESSLQSV